MNTMRVVAVVTAVVLGAIFVPQATSAILAVLAVPMFGWAVLGLVAPAWARLPDRRASVKVWAGSVALVVVSFLVTLAQSDFRQDLSETMAAQERIAGRVPADSVGA